MLFLAVEADKSDLVKFFLKKLDVNKVVDRKTAADVAYEQSRFEIIFILLKSNSRFPNDSKIPKDFEIPSELRKFVEMSKKFHDSIENGNKEEMMKILAENRGLKYFFNTKNLSAIALSISKKLFEIYEILIEENLSLGPHEIFDDLIEKLTDGQKRKLRRIHSRKFHSIAEKHILTLMANTNVGFDDEERQKRLSVVSQGEKKPKFHLSISKKVTVVQFLIKVFPRK